MKGTIFINWGAYGGFYCGKYGDNCYRLCLGWIAFTLFTDDFDDFVEDFVDYCKNREKKRRTESVTSQIQKDEYPEHCCGLQGFDPMQGDSCPACDKMKSG